jgi:flagellar biosynthetic protein FliR
MTIAGADLLSWIQTGLLVLARIASLVMLAPVFGERAVPPQVRIVLALLLTLLVFPLVVMPDAPLVMFSAAWFLAMAQQIAIGMAMGLCLRIVLEAFALGGELIANSVGLGFAQLADPVRGVSTPIVGQFLIVVATLLFVASGAHLLVLEALADGFRQRPVSDTAVDLKVLRLLLDWAGSLFAGGLQLALPVLGAMLAVNLSLGVLGRAAPAINLMAVGFPLTLILGLWLMRATLPSLGVLLEQWLDQALPLVQNLPAQR